MIQTRSTKRFDPLRIRDARQMVGLSTRQFGASIGKTDQTVRNWENGTTSPTIRDLETLCEKYGFDLSYFITAKPRVA